MQRVVSIFITIICVISGAGAATVNIRVYDGQSLFSHNQVLLDIAVRDAGQGRATFDGDALQIHGRAGQPAMPRYNCTVLLPDGTFDNTVRVSLRNADYQPIDGVWQVSPLGPLATSPNPDDNATPPDPDIYTRNAHWPQARASILSVGQVRTHKVARIALPAAQYNPVTGQVLLLSHADIDITTVRSAYVVSRQPDAAARRWLKQSALNYTVVDDPAISGYTSDSATSAGLELAPSDTSSNTTYLIVTTSAIESASTVLPAFIAHKQSRGFNVQVATETDFGGGTGDTAAENIRTYLQAHYLTDNIEYVLLIGPQNTSTGTVPMKMIYADDSESAPSDAYYSDLTGDWDLDGDGLYGEFDDDFGIGGVDRNWDVLVGRIPYYDQIAHLDAILQKSIDYDTQIGPDTDWRTAAILPMRRSDSTTPGHTLGEQIKDLVLTPAQWGYHRVYDDEEYNLVPPPETVPCTYTTVRNAWTSQPFSLAVWWAHGSSTHADKIIDTAGTAYLDDSYPVFSFQASCHNATPEIASNLAYSLLRNGGVCTIGATRTSYYAPGQEDHTTGFPTNSALAWEYASRVVANRWTGSRSLQDIRITLTPGQWELWKNMITFNLFGDPSLCLWPEYTPACGDAFHPPPTGDITADCRVDADDYSVLHAHWLDDTCTDPTWCNGTDLTGDGTTDLADLAVLARHWQTCTAPECE